MFASKGAGIIIWDFLSYYIKQVVCHIWRQRFQAAIAKFSKWGDRGMEDKNEKILHQGFGLTGTVTSRIRGGFLCQTNQGEKQLRKTLLDAFTLHFLDAAKEYLHDVGFRYVDRYRKTLDGAPFYDAEGCRYILTDNLKCQELNFYEEKDLRLAARTLAKFHTASQGFDFRQGKTGLGRLPQQFEKRRGELAKIKKGIEHAGKLNEMDLVVFKNFNYYWDKVELAYSILKTSGYQELAQKAMREGCLCHNAFKGENLFLAEDGNVLVTGFEHASIDLPVLDLSELLRRVVKHEEIQIHEINILLEEYELYRPLCAQERRVLFALLCYPGKFLKLLNKYYNQRRSCICEAAVQKLQRCVLEKPRWQETLDSLSWLLKP